MRLETGVAPPAGSNQGSQEKTPCQTCWDLANGLEGKTETGGLLRSPTATLQKRPKRRWGDGTQEPPIQTHGPRPQGAHGTGLLAVRAGLPRVSEPVRKSPAHRWGDAPGPRAAGATRQGTCRDVGAGKAGAPRSPRTPHCLGQKGSLKNVDRSTFF